MTDKSLKVFIGMIAFAAVLLVAPQRASAQSLAAQLSDKEIPVSEFNALDVSNDFEVTLSRGAYAVRMTVDKELAPYVEVYVKAKTLYISYDEKAVPKELKKLYKGKGGLTPVFRVTAYTPELQSLTLSDNATFIGIEEFTASQFELTATGKSQVNNLMVSATSAKINLKKNALATLNVKTQRGLEVSTENNSNLKLDFTGDELALNAEGASVVVAEGPCTSMNLFSAGSSQVSVTSETQKVDLNMEGNSKVVLAGKAETMTVNGTRNATLDAFSMPIEEIDAHLAQSSEVTVTVSKLVSASLVGNSALYYSGTPEFKIDKIVKSTLAPYGTK